MTLRETPVDQQIQYEGRLIRVRVDIAQLPNGIIATREVVEHNGGVCIAALTEQQELLFVRQFRYPYQEVVLELPAGKIDKGEEPLACGKRELTEETGASAQQYRSLGRLYPSPGYSGEVIHLFLATGLSFGRMNLDEDEFLEVERIPLEKAVQMVLDNEVPDAKTQVAVLKTWALLHSGKAL